MAQKGWYPDPGGAPGMFRYWDGAAWSEVVSPTPLPGPPSQYGAPTPTPGAWDGTQPLSVGGRSDPYQAGPQPTPYQSSGPSTATSYGQSWSYPNQPPPRSRRPVGLWLTIVAGVLVIALVAWYVVTQVFGGTVIPQPTDNPGGTSTTAICPKQPAANERVDHPNDGRVYGGGLSYPMLGAPWSYPDTGENRVPFGRDVATQNILIHSNPNATGPDDWQAWVASVLVGELNAGDGFYPPEQASQIVNKCIIGKFYGTQSVVTPNVLRSEPFKVDGYDGWITETDLSFDIPNLDTTSELAIVIIVATSDMSSSIFYASIPNDAMQYEPDVRAAIANLHVT